MACLESHKMVFKPVYRELQRNEVSKCRKVCLMLFMSSTCRCCSCCRMKLLYLFYLYCMVNQVLPTFCNLISRLHFRVLWIYVAGVWHRLLWKHSRRRRVREPCDKLKAFSEIVGEIKNFSPKKDEKDSKIETREAFSNYDENGRVTVHFGIRIRTCSQTPGTNQEVWIMI